MTAFEKWQVWVLTIQTAILLVTALAAIYIGLKQVGIGVKQNEISNRLKALQDYVAVALVPLGSLIKVLNTGRTNLYLWGFDMPGNKKMLERPRLLPAGTGGAAYYWLPPPSADSLQSGREFDITLYLKDEFGDHWLSQHGGSIEIGKEKLIDEKMKKEYEMTIWSYKIEKKHW